MGNCFSCGIEKPTAETEKKSTVGRTDGGRVLAEAKTETKLSAKEAAARAAEARYNSTANQGGELSQKLNKENRKSILQIRKEQAESNINSRNQNNKLVYD